MLETEPRPEDSRALELALALDRAGTHKDLSARLRVLVGTENEGRLLAATRQAAEVLLLKATEVETERRLAAEREPDEAIEPVEEKAQQQPDPDAAADAVIPAMITQARKFIAAETDAPDVAAMRDILARLEKLDSAEAAEPESEKAGSTYEKPAAMPAEVQTHLAHHKRMMQKYGVGPMNEWANEMGIEMGASNGNG